MPTSTLPTSDHFFDVRDIPCRVKHAQILARWQALPLNDYFVLVNDHDPVPLRYQFSALFGDEFSWDYLVTGPEEYHVKISRIAPARNAAAPMPESCTPSVASSPVDTTLDLRGLQPPEPMVRILNALDPLPVGSELSARTDRKPLLLLAELESRNISHASEALSDGSWITRLTKR